jgi:hypothetical protein
VIDEVDLGIAAFQQHVRTAGHLFRELSVRVRKRMAVRLFSGLLSRFDSDEKLVPFVMLA